MGIIIGQVNDKNGRPVAQADVGVMNQHFEPIAQTKTDEHGQYTLELPDGQYPFFLAVKDYGVNGLEYWCHDIVLEGKLELSCQIDKLEIYGLNLFTVKGAGPALSIYFRPMSLEKFLAGEKDIAPSITEQSLTCLVNGELCDLLVMNRVREYTTDGPLTACLIQITRPGTLLDRNKLDLLLEDEAGNFGMGSLFFSREHI